MQLILTSPAAGPRLLRAERWLAARPLGALVVGATLDGARQLARRAASAAGAGFGWQTTTLDRLAAGVAAPALAAAGIVAATPLSLEAVSARTLHRLREEQRLGRLTAIADRPGLPAALLRTLTDLRMAGAAAALPGELAAALAAYRAELTRAGLADRAEVFQVAAAELPARLPPLVVLDVELATAAEAAFLAVLAARAAETLVTVPAGDERTLATLRALLPGAAPMVEEDAGDPTPLGRLAAGLFDDGAPAVPDADMVLLSAPGESRECVELARRARAEAARGVRWDQMAILLRSPGAYRTGLEEALRRAAIPAHFAAGTRRPDPAGRAFLSLLGCAAEGLSARRFAEYLSLGEVPDPAGRAEGAGWVPGDDELADDKSEETEAADAPALATPRRWEKLLVDAAVIGGRERWRRRLDGLEARARLALAELDGDEAERADGIRRTLADLDRLRAFALPLLDALTALPAAAPWGAWLAALEALAARALRRPDRVLAVLGELRPMADVGPVGLAEVRLVLRRRLGDAAVPPPSRPPGRLLVAPIDAARGLSFEVVFLPGLAEKGFPPKLAEDPLLPDEQRAVLGLPGGAERLAGERLRLRLAVGAAARRLVASYPRLDLENGRARVPSLYALELCRAHDGQLPAADELARQAELEGAARAGWPAPPRAADAIDDAEHDLATLLVRDLGRGAARYLIDANPHLAASLRARYQRHRHHWTGADGLVLGPNAAAARAALAPHLPDQRPFSATGLQRLAKCPYQFYLGSLLKLAARESPEPIEEIDPLARGSLVHEVQFRVAGALRDAGLLPVTAAELPRAQELLGRALAEVAAEYRDKLCPAIDRVWEDGIDSVRADLHDWLERAAGEREWVPYRFELAFGLTENDGRDPESRDDPVLLDCGILLRGSIDLVERAEGGALRVTDHKTGKARAQRGQIIGGGLHLQPVLYALALEKMFPGVEVRGGRLYYCTQVGGFSSVETRLDEAARRAAGAVARFAGETIAAGQFPAAPAPGECQWCDYAPICGPGAEERAARKTPVDMLLDLRGMR